MDRPLVTITGPSGVGKTTVVQLLYTIAPLSFTELVSTTTRAPRTGEREGVAYYFVDDAEFERRSEDQRFLEEIEYNGTRYGIESSEIEKAHSAGLTPLIVVEPHGARQIRERYAGTLIQLYLNANEKRLRRWMLGRGDHQAKVAERIALDRTAITQGDFPWDLVIENDTTVPSLCAKVMKAIAL
jgi:guanylate kinase